MSNRTLIVVIAFFTLSLLAICFSTAVSAGNRHNRTTLKDSPVIEDPETTVSNISCDAVTPCPPNMECWQLGEGGPEGPTCVTPNPQGWYCKEGKKPVVEKGSPPMLTCE